MNKGNIKNTLNIKIILMVRNMKEKLSMIIEMGKECINFDFNYIILLKITDNFKIFFDMILIIFLLMLQLYIY